MDILRHPQLNPQAWRVKAGKSHFQGVNHIYPALLPFYNFHQVKYIVNGHKKEGWNMRNDKVATQVYAGYSYRDLSSTSRTRARQVTLPLPGFHAGRSEWERRGCRPMGE